MDVTIVIATYGDRKWIEIAEVHAMSSISNLQMHTIPLVRLHGGHSIAESRNTAASLVDTEWICFLDADDQLTENYFKEMEVATGDLRAPRLFFPDQMGLMWHEPFDLTKRNMDTSNPCPIGTLIRKEMFDRVGGFWDEPVYEDWSLFRRAWLLGATIEHTNAEYLANNFGGRNSSTDDPIAEINKIRSSHKEWLREVSK